MDGEALATLDTLYQQYGYYAILRGLRLILAERLRAAQRERKTGMCKWLLWVRLQAVTQAARAGVYSKEELYG